MPRMCAALMGLLLCSPLLVQAEIYRWVDAEGRVHFGERPQGSGAQTVDVKPQVIESDEYTRESQQRMQQILNARDGERADQQANQQQQQAERAQMQAKCDNLRGELDNVKRGGAFYRYNDQGEREYYKDSEVDAARQRMEENYARYCQ